VSEFGGQTDENPPSLALLLPRANQSPRITITYGPSHVIACAKVKCQEPITFAAWSAQSCSSDFRAEPQNSVLDRQSLPESFLLKYSRLAGPDQLFAKI
jgi:hypothetical protein